MKKTIVSILSVCAAGTSANSQEPARSSPHHWGVGAPVWLNAKASFTAARASNPGAAPGAPATLANGRVDRFYDDGFNRVNAAGNPVLIPGGGPLTTFFGYQSDTQVANAPGAGTLSLHSIQVSGGSYSEKLNNKRLPGVEGFYRYDWKKGEDWSMDWEFAVGYQNFNWRENGAATTVDLITDTFGLNGVALPIPGAPFAGPFTPAPGSPAIDSTPTRTVANVPATVVGFRRVEMHAIQMRVAPAVNWHPNEKWSLGLQAGLTLGVGFSELDFDEQITVAAPGTPVISQAGSSTESHFWAGVFSALRIRRRFDDHWTAHADIRHIYTRKLRHTGTLRSAEISLSEGFGVAGAISYNF